MARGVVLCGGMGTRLRPATSILNKHLLPIGTVPMVLYPIHTLKKIGVTDILIVTGGEHMGDFAEFLGDGSKYDVNFTYKVQTKAGGIAEALLLAEDFAAGADLWVILGDNIYGNHGFPFHMLEDVEPVEPVVVICPVEDNHRFGVPVFDEKGVEIVNIIEKPENPVNDLAVTGLYHYPPGVFDVIREQVPSARGELEITDTNNYYAHKGILEHYFLASFWSDCGTPESLAKTTKWFLDNPDDSFTTALTKLI